MFKLSELSLANRSLVGLLALTLVALGLFATGSLRQELFPPVNEPRPMVHVFYHGASAEYMEREFVRPIEEEIQNLDGLRNVRAQASDGFASITAEFAVGTDGQDAADAIQRELAPLAATFPEEAGFGVRGSTTDDDMVMLLSVSSDEDEGALAEAVNGEIVPRLEAMPGVQSVTTHGQRLEVLEIDPDQDELEELGLTEQDIVALLHEKGAVESGGTLSNDERVLTADVGATFESLQTIEDLYLMPRLSQEDPVRLGEIAEVGWALPPLEVENRANGRDAIGITVDKEPDANAVEVSESIHAELDELEQALGGGGELDVSVDLAPFISDSITGLVEKGFSGLLILLGMILLFLRSLRTTLVTAVSIPLSLLISLIAIWALGLSLNILTLAALAIAAARVVDDSIVIVENIRRHQAYGAPKMETILNAVREVAAPVFSSTLTAVAVFLPLVFVGGETGEFFGPFALTISVALVISMVIALTVTPVLAYWFLKFTPVDGDDPEGARREAEEAERRTWTQRVYIPFLEWVTARREKGWRTWHRWMIIAVSVFMLIGTFGLAGTLRATFLEDENQSQLQVVQSLPTGTAVPVTNVAAEKVEEVLLDIDEVRTFTTTVGGGAMTLEPHMVTHWVTIDSDAETHAVRSAIESELEQLDDIGELSVAALLSEGPGGDFAEVELSSDDNAALREATELIEDELSGIDGVADLNSDLTNESPTLTITPDEEEMARLGLSNADLAGATRSSLEGFIRLSTVVEGTERQVQVVTADPAVEISDLEQFELFTQEGPVELGDIAEVEEVERPLTIIRDNGERSVTVTATIEEGDVAAVSARINERVDDLDLPDEVIVQTGGTAEELDEASQQMGIAILMSVAFVFIIMVGQFRSMGQPLILLSSIPFIATGAILALYITGKPLTVTAMIGMLMLVGIAATNSILIISLINIYRGRGVPLSTAVIEGGRQRLRPVLMTALTTCAALVPLALRFGTESVFIAQSLAIVVIGGLLSTTFLTLILVPVLYVMLEERKERKRERREAKALTRAEKSRAAEKPESDSGEE